MTHTQEHKLRITRRREEQHARTRSYRYVDKSKYKGSRILTSWYSFRLELIAESIREIGKIRT